MIAEALTGDFSDALRADLSERTRALAERHPLYPQFGTATILAPSADQLREP